MLNKDEQVRLFDRYSHPRKMAKQAFDRGILEGFDAEFTTEQTVESSCLYVDISGFSSRVASFSPREVRSFLDDYYAVAIPLVKIHGGMIDRIAGDGIIAVFSSFFDKNTSYQQTQLRAMSAASDIVWQLKDSPLASKAALSFGELLFCKTGIESIYEDFSVLGNPLTELYRLESVANQNQIIFRGGTQFARQLDRQAKLWTIQNSRKPRWVQENPGWILESAEFDLRGVSQYPVQCMIKYVA
ncbi:MAG: adenylate/guanylate cyclase domain-containing protein [Verrucomicrobiaceae bacterium]|nr:MAG: adenylate/guanylate cyclase domain-containing protein [Verrucomicrobiaceae bacterium]